MSRLMMCSMLFGATISAAACGGKKDDPAPAGSASGSAEVKPVAGSGSGSAVAAGSGSAAPTAGSGSGSATPTAVAKQVEVPTAEDFEDDASARITEKNVETEVKALEKEIGDN